VITDEAQQAFAGGRGHGWSRWFHLKKFKQEAASGEVKIENGFFFGLRWRRGRLNLAANLLIFQPNGDPNRIKSRRRSSIATDN
jgi:hypothetical protein